MLGAQIIVSDVQYSIHDVDKCIEIATPNFVVVDMQNPSRILAKRAQDAQNIKIIKWKDTQSNWDSLSAYPMYERYEKKESTTDAKGIFFITYDLKDYSICLLQPSIKSIYLNADFTSNILKLNSKSKVMHTMDWNSRIGLFGLLHCFCLKGGAVVISTEITFSKKIQSVVHATHYLDSANQYIDIIENKLLHSIDINQMPETCLVTSGALPYNYQVGFIETTHRNILLSINNAFFGFVGFQTQVDIPEHTPDYSFRTDEYNLHHPLDAYQKIPKYLELKCISFKKKIWNDFAFPESNQVGDIIYIDRETEEEYSFNDCGYIDKNNRLVYYGSKNYIVDIRGLKISEYQIEKYLLDSVHIKDCAVITLPHPAKERALCGLIVTKNHAKKYATDYLRQRMYGYIASYKIPLKLITCSSLRRKKTGFVDKEFYTNHYYDIFSH